MDKKENIEKYAEDIATIKSLLMVVEEKSFIENWAFFIWGGLCLIGSVAHFLLINYTILSVIQILVRVWTPIMLIAIFFEAIAWIKKMTKESLPLFSRTQVKAWLTDSGCFISMCVTLHILLKINAVAYIPIVILLNFAVFLLIYAQISDSHLYIIGYLLLLSSIILYFLEFEIHYQFITMGLLFSIIFFTAGIIGWLKEKKEKKEKKI